MSIPVKFLVNFCIIMAIQLFLLNDIVIKSSITLLGIPAFIPMLYPLILLLLPVNTPHWLAMVLGFLTGILMDYFCNTPGMHAAACVLLCYIRPYLLRLFFQQSEKELGGVVPSLFRMGIGFFLFYISVSILVHHLFFYTLQIWSLKNILFILFKTLLSGVISVLLIILSQLLFAQRDIRRS
jgi:rod shape-determining protein MreD